MSKIIIETELKELPENCYDCPFSINGICQADNQKRTSQEYRPFWCPMKIKKIKVDNSDYWENR